MSDLSYLAYQTGASIKRLAIAASTGMSDAFKLVATGADGKIDPSLLPASAGGSADWAAVSGSSAILNKPTLGTAAAKNVPATGNAATGEVVKGDDSRLSDTRTPTAHSHAQSESHGSPDTDAGVSALHHTIGGGANQAAAGNHSHAEIHSHTNKTVVDKFSEVGGILKYDGGDLPTSSGGGDMYKSANLAGLASPGIARSNLGLGSASTKNTPVSGDASSTECVLGGDSRLSGARPPTAHNHPQSESHTSTDVNASPSALHHTIGVGANQAAPGSHVGLGGNEHALAAAGGASGFMSGADKAKLDSVSVAGDSATSIGYAYTLGKLTSSTETLPVGTRVTTFNYTGSVLTTVVSTLNGKTRTETYSYTSGALTSVAVTEV